MKRFLKVLCVILLLGVLVSPSAAMTDNQRLLCHGIIHTATAAAAGSAAALSQMPGADNIALAGILGTMTVGLANVFDISFGQASAETVGLTVLTYFGGPIATRTVSQWLAGWIPLAGNALNAATMTALVEYIGWTMADAFDSGEWALWKIGGAFGTLVVGGQATGGKTAPSRK